MFGRRGVSAAEAMTGAQRRSHADDAQRCQPPAEPARRPGDEARVECCSMVFILHFPFRSTHESLDSSRLCHGIGRLPSIRVVPGCVCRSVAQFRECPVAARELNELTMIATPGSNLICIKRCMASQKAAVTGCGTSAAWAAAANGWAAACPPVRRSGIEASRAARS